MSPGDKRGNMKRLFVIFVMALTLCIFTACGEEEQKTESAGNAVESIAPPPPDPAVVAPVTPAETDVEEKAEEPKDEEAKPEEPKEEAKPEESAETEEKQVE